MKRNIKIGILLGVISSIITFISLFNTISLFYIKCSFVLLLFVGFGFLFWAVKKFKQENMGIATYGESLKVTFIVLIVSMTITQASSIIFFNVIAPDYYQTHKTDILAHDIHLVIDLSANDVNIQEPIDNSDSNIDKRIFEMEQRTNTFKGIITGFGTNIFTCLVLCLIVSIFLKKAPKKEVIQSV